MTFRPDDIRAASVTLLGLQVDENSSYLKGTAQAPARIREALFAGSSNSYAEDGTEVLSNLTFSDAGDLAPGPGEAGAQAIENAVRTIFERSGHPLCLGGDHSVTYPIVKAFAARYSELSVLHLDAHPDLYDAFEGNRFSHASPFARILEAGLVKRLVQVGIRTMNLHQKEQAERFGVEVVAMRDVAPDLRLEFATPLYVSIDLDVLDPAYAPGVSHYEPGGMSVRDLLGILERTRGQVVGADVVELNPLRDPAGITAFVAAKLVKELAARMSHDASAAAAARYMRS
jgi:agmatinase